MRSPGWQDALGGNSKTVVVANVAPGVASVRETLSTLGFAQRAKQARTPLQLAGMHIWFRSLRFGVHCQHKWRDAYGCNCPASSLVLLNQGVTLPVTASMRGVSTAPGRLCTAVGPSVHKPGACSVHSSAAHC